MVDTPRLLFGQPRVVPAGWPPDMAAHDVITAGHINAIKASVYQWPGEVNAGGFRLINTGNVGIGTPTPGAELHIYKASPYAQLLLEGGGNSDTGYIVKDAARTFKLGINVATGGVGKFQIYAFTPGRSVFVCDDQNAYLQPSGGNVGIGMATAPERLSVTGPPGGHCASFTDATNSTLRILHSSTEIPNGVLFDGGGSSSIGFRTNNALRMMITGNEGRVGIGTGAPEQLLHVKNSTSYAKLKLEGVNTSSTALVIKDSVRTYEVGINIDSTAAGSFQIYGIRTMIACGDSDIKMYLGGSLKTLSVDGSGFVKAT